jgi:hypothetical protein
LPQSLSSTTHMPVRQKGATFCYTCNKIDYRLRC